HAAEEGAQHTEVENPADGKVDGLPSPCERRSSRCPDRIAFRAPLEGGDRRATILEPEARRDVLSKRYAAQCQPRAIEHGRGQDAVERQTIGLERDGPRYTALNLVETVLRDDILQYSLRRVVRPKSHVCTRRLRWQRAQPSLERGRLRSARL